jgi:hypothetical protein
VSGRCADLSLAAGEPLGATAVTATRWLLVEVAGSWPRDVADEGPLPVEAAEVVSEWLRTTPSSRLHFLRRPGRTGDRLLAYAVRSDESVTDVRRIELGSLADLATLDVDSAGDVVDGALVLVCGHGSRDRCCALRGTAVFAALAERLGDEELWISSHQGGHRFAANVLVLPAGIQLGRVDTDQAPFLVARALAGRIDLDHCRGRTCYEPTVQAAELAVRRETGLDGIADLTLEERASDVVTFETGAGERLTARVEEIDGPSVPPSCGAEPAPQRSLRARLV